MKSLLLAALLLMPAQQSEPLWTVVFRFKQDNVNLPECRIYIMVRASQEGEAAIKANRYIMEKLSIAAQESIIYVEAQKREDPK